MASCHTSSFSNLNIVRPLHSPLPQPSTLNSPPRLSTVLLPCCQGVATVPLPCGYGILLCFQGFAGALNVRPSRLRWPRAFFPHPMLLPRQPAALPQPLPAAPLGPRRDAGRPLCLAQRAAIPPGCPLQAIAAAALAGCARVMMLAVQVPELPPTPDVEDPVPAAPALEPRVEALPRGRKERAAKAKAAAPPDLWPGLLIRVGLGHSSVHQARCGLEAWLGRKPGPTPARHCSQPAPQSPPCQAFLALENAANYLVGQSRDGGEWALGNRLSDTQGFCKSQVTLNSRLGRQRATTGMSQRLSQRPGGL